MKKDAGSRLTPLGVMALGLLREGDMHPYEMMRVMRSRRDDRLAALTNGTFYHTVSRLEQAGLIAEVGTDRDGNRPARTTYALTDAGAAASAAWIRRELPLIDRLPEFRVALSEAHDLPREEVIALLAARRHALATTLEEHRTGLAGALERRVPLQFLIELERSIALLSAEVAWHDAIAERLADHTIPWGSHDDPAPHREAPLA